MVWRRFPMESAGVAQLKARLSEYLSRVKAGEEVLVTDRGRPIARLVPVGAGYVPDNEAEPPTRCESPTPCKPLQKAWLRYRKPDGVL
jgi:prevent-host-death family protein